MENTNIEQWQHGNMLENSYRHNNVPVPLCPLRPMWTGPGLKLEIQNEKLVIGRQTA